MNTYKKISEEKVEITTPNLEVVTLKELQERKKRLEDNIALAKISHSREQEDLDSRLAETNNAIKETEKLGIK